MIKIIAPHCCKNQFLFFLDELLAITSVRPQDSVQVRRSFSRHDRHVSPVRECVQHSVVFVEKATIAAVAGESFILDVP